MQTDIGPVASARFAATQRTPRSTRRKRPSSQPQSLTVRTLAGMPILVVEDDPASARLVSVLLTSEGADVRVAHNAEEAFAILKVFSSRVIVVDLVLPRMSGLLLVKRLKSDPTTAGIVAVAMSVVNGPETERLARESGCTAYIRKPIDIQTFASTLMTAVTG